MHMPGGDLLISLRESDGHVLLEGPAERVFEGTTPVRAAWLA
jgi:diaminopimelate epimerase